MSITNAKQEEMMRCDLLQENFFKYYTFNNLYYEHTQTDGSKQKNEFLDALVIFEYDILIFQMKGGNENPKAIASFNYEKSLEEGLKKQLQMNKEKMESNWVNISDIILYQTNGERGNKLQKTLNPINYCKNEKTKCFYILCMEGEPTDDIKNNPNPYQNGYFIFKNHDHFEKTLKHCNTIKDFVNYLKFLESIKGFSGQFNSDNVLAFFLSMERRDDIQIYIKKNNLKGIPEGFLDLQNEKIFDMLNKETESLKEIDENIIKNCIYNDLSMSEEEKEKFCKYIVGQDRHSRREFCECINQMKQQSSMLVPSGWLFSKDNFDGTVFRFIQPDYNKISLHLNYTLELAKKFVMDNTNSFENINNIRVNFKEKAGGNISNVERYIVINYTDKTFKIYKK